MMYIINKSSIALVKSYECNESRQITGIRSQSLDLAFDHLVLDNVVFLDFSFVVEVLNLNQLVDVDMNE